MQDGFRARIERNRRLSVERRSAVDSPDLPALLLKTTPRSVRVNAAGRMLLFGAVALIAAGIWGGIELNRRAETAARHASLFESERVLAAGDIVHLRKRGGDDEHRITAHYRYSVRGRELTGQTTLRRDDNDTFAIGTPVGVWYLPSEPDASWLDGYVPRRDARWPATVVPFACGVAALGLIAVVRRQANLLTYGRPAMATVTRIEKKSTDKGTVWVVHYEFTTLSGATRTGTYHERKKALPDVGAAVPVVYDRDNTFRHSKYPMRFVESRK
jgi:hypothetical protein